ncbi:hypothetical protein [Streptomyces sp. HGB0020]|jgi:hypothetical protein|uniref:hypothetical protein n=1 Tax=Streptomyces sp. HGB0020 TaxID=1078086 RepID=UPI00034E08F3|nr:hypothetical protein [Streptomyces sp. HGB0020]EPD62393.1 hypothetical protein HMPREF1211_04027 [Streptomyces sp. HGB0020]
MTTTADSPEAILAAADAEIAEADAALENLEQRVLDDDPEVGPEQIEQARSRRYFAGLGRKRAERKATALREAEATQARTVAMIEARRILDEVPQADVDQALAAAGEAMQKLRDVVRARNDARDRALQVLRDCPAIEAVERPSVRLRGEQPWQGPEFGIVRNDGYGGDRWLLYADGRPLPRLDENQLLDQARKAPGQADYQAGQEQAAQARERRQADREARRQARRATDPNAL